MFDLLRRVPRIYDKVGLHGHSSFIIYKYTMTQAFVYLV